MKANRNLELTSEQEQEMLMELLECEHPLERINVYGQYGQLLRIENVRKAMFNGGWPTDEERDLPSDLCQRTVDHIISQVKKWKGF